MEYISLLTPLDEYCPRSHLKVVSKGRNFYIRARKVLATRVEVLSSGPYFPLLGRTTMEGGTVLGQGSPSHSVLGSNMRTSNSGRRPRTRACSQFQRDREWRNGWRRPVQLDIGFCGFGVSEGFRDGYRRPEITVGVLVIPYRPFVTRSGSCGYNNIDHRYSYDSHGSGLIGLATVWKMDTRST